MLEGAVCLLSLPCICTLTGLGELYGSISRYISTLSNVMLGLLAWMQGVHFLSVQCYTWFVGLDAGVMADPWLMEGNYVDEGS